MSRRQEKIDRRSLEERSVVRNANQLYHWRYTIRFDNQSETTALTCIRFRQTISRDLLPGARRLASDDFPRSSGKGWASTAFPTLRGQADASPGIGEGGDKPESEELKPLFEDVLSVISTVS